MDDIHHRLTHTLFRPARDENENLTAVLSFMQECDSEIPNRFLSLEFEGDESDEEPAYDDDTDTDTDTDTDQYDDLSRANICEFRAEDWYAQLTIIRSSVMEPGSMPPGSLHLLRVSDDGTYITIEPFDSDNSEPPLSPFNSMRKVEMIKPATPTVGK